LSLVEESPTMKQQHAPPPPPPSWSNPNEAIHEISQRVVCGSLIAVGVLFLALAVLASGCALQGGTINTGPRQKTYAEIDQATRDKWAPSCRDIWLQELGRAIDQDGLETCITQFANGATSEAIRASVRASKEYAQHQADLQAAADAAAAAAAEAAKHVDPSGIPLAQLAAIRGAMWPRANICADPPILPFGIRPNQPDNIIATTYFDNYTSAQQEAIARCLKSVGLTHVVVGGLVDWWAYHGQYSGHDYSTPEGFEKFLDLHQWFYDHQLTPVTFIHVDGASFDETQQLVNRLIVGNPRAQKLIRIVVMPGWEPAKYEWSSCTWAKYVHLARDALPNALNLIHTVSDVDAPVGTDALCNDDDKTWNPGGNGAGWARVINAGLHGWLIQNGPYAGGPNGSRQTAEFAAQFQSDGDGATYHGAAWHFAGHAGWPTSSAWGSGIPICLYNAEATAYEAYWSNRPSEADRAAWGDLAVNSGACGYLDGGNVSVPVRR
jgi:hypothetical protein